MRVLAIDDATKARAQEIITYARRHVYFPYLSPVVPGDDPRQVADISTYRCVFSFTNMNGKLYRHLSISVPSQNYPHPAAVVALAEIFGFSHASESMQIEYHVERSGWMVKMNEEEHCIVLAEELH